jgi:streptomycin 6-kinase
VSVVFRCQTSEGRPAVVKISPDRARLVREAAALNRWTTTHTPTVFGVDENLGALLLEAIEPGTPLVESLAYPRLDSMTQLLTSLYEHGAPDPTYPPLAQRVTYLFDSGLKHYTLHPELIGLIPRQLYERGQNLATRLAEHAAPTALLHGDLTPRNILDGGTTRGLVAIDPTPCLGNDLAFDAVDLLLWQAADLNTITARARQLAPTIGVDLDRLLDWCTAFAAMTALELAGLSHTPHDRIQAAVTVAGQAPAA